MASTYTELKTEIADWLARADLTSKVDSFIDFGEAWLNRKLRVKAMQTTADLTIDSGSIAEPTGMIRARRIYINSDPKARLDYMTPEQFHSVYAGSETGKPKIFTIEGNNILFAPSPDSAYTGKILYYKAFTALDDSNTTNWLLTNHPDLYLAACLSPAEAFIMNDQRIAMWKQYAMDTVEELNTQDWDGEHSGATLQVRSDVNNP